MPPCRTLSQYRSAGEGHRAVLELRPKDASVYAARARAFLRDRKIDKTLADLDEAIWLEPKDTSLLTLRGGIYTEKGQL